MGVTNGSESSFVSIFKRKATILKLVGVSVLALLLFIPLGLIGSLLSERLSRRNEVVSEITSIWGKEQTVVGPVLVVPYRYSFKAIKEEVVAGVVTKREVIETAVANAYFLPASLSIEGSISPRILHRAIYEAVVYSGTLQMSGHFTRPDFEIWKVESKDILWGEALLTFAITDLRGTKEALILNWDEAAIPLAPGVRLRGFSSGIHARIKDLKGDEANLPFALTLTLNGSRSIQIAPVGLQTTIKLSSPWPDPSFEGAFLPTERSVTSAGFNALWQVSYYGRDYAQQWNDQDSKSELSSGSASGSLCGTAFLSVIDAYRNVERAIKYGILFIALTFAAFFLFEVLSSIRIHVFQYTLVGVALCLFYLALLSLSEFIAFPVSYLFSSGASTLLVCLYSLKVLKSGRRTLIIAALSAAIYGMLYISLQMHDYSLLLCTIALFTVLAVVMYVTRNIDWYARDQTP